MNTVQDYLSLWDSNWSTIFPDIRVY